MNVTGLASKALLVAWWSCGSLCVACCVLPSWNICIDRVRQTSQLASGEKWNMLYWQIWELSKIGVRLLIHDVSTVYQAKLEIRDWFMTVAFLILATRCHQHVHTGPKKPICVYRLKFRIFSDYSHSTSTPFLKPISDFFWWQNTISYKHFCCHLCCIKSERLSLSDQTNFSG